MTFGPLLAICIRHCDSQSTTGIAGRNAPSARGAFCAFRGRADAICIAFGLPICSRWHAVAAIEDVFSVPFEKEPLLPCRRLAKGHG